MKTDIHRRRLLSAGLLAGTGIAFTGLFPEHPALDGENIALTVGDSRFTVNGRTGHAISVNGTIPAPLIRLREGQNVRIAVTNTLDEDTSIHWHGVLLPFDMDGVPGVSFPGIRPGETFVYEFPIRHAGTFWYHSHSNLQEQLGHYGPLIFDPAGSDPVEYDREHIMVLSDWSFMHPHKIMQKLKQDPGYFNSQKQTLAGLFRGSDAEGRMTMADRLMWQRMRMDPTDIADVTGSTYTYLVNGHGPQENWTALFRPGERVRLRIINASAMTVFNVRIPDLYMTVVNADGNNVQPVDVDEFQISVAETYDVVVQPTEAMGMAMHHDVAERNGNHDRHDSPSSSASKVDLGPGVDMIAMHPQDAAGKRGHTESSSMRTSWHWTQTMTDVHHRALSRST